MTAQNLLGGLLNNTLAKQRINLPTSGRNLAMKKLKSVLSKRYSTKKSKKLTLFKLSKH